MMDTTTSADINSQPIDEEARKKAESMKELEPVGRRRVLAGPIGIAATCIAVAFALFHLDSEYRGA